MKGLFGKSVSNPFRKSASDGTESPNRSIFSFRKKRHNSSGTRNTIDSSDSRGNNEPRSNALDRRGSLSSVSDEDRDEYEVVWAGKEGTPLGIWLQPNFAQMVFVAHVEPTRAVKNVQQVKVGDILLEVNGMNVQRNFDAAIEKIKTLPKPITLRFLSMKKASSAPRYHGPRSTVSMYSVVWAESAPLGVHLKKDSSVTPSRTVIKKFETQRTAGLEAASVGDILVKVGSHSTTDMDFKQTIALMQTISRPVLLTFQIRESLENNLNHTTVIQSSEKEKAAVLEKDSAFSQMDPVEYEVHYTGGKLGIVLTEGSNSDSHPVVYKVKDRCSAQGLDRAAKGDELISIDGKDTSSLGFDATVKYIQRIRKPTVLVFRKSGKKVSYTGLIFEVIGAMFV